MSVYRVVGSLKYREHSPGEEFIARLTPAEEQRAVERGNIVVVIDGPITLDESKIRRPKG